MLSDEQREALLEELCRLYRLKAEGKKVDNLIQECEERLFGAIDEKEGDN